MIRPRPLLRRGAAAVFLFHGVLGEPRVGGIRNYTGKHIPLAAFEDFLDEAADAGVPVTIDEVAAAAATGTPLPDRAFAITFDDGFANNLAVAAPALEARGIPATIYVTSAFVADGACSWIDLIEYAFERSEAESIELPFLRADLTTRDAKIATLDAIRREGKARRDLDPYLLAEEVWRQLGITELEPDPELDRKLGWDDLRRLARNPLFTIGGHGQTHRILGYLDQDELERELAESLGRLHDELGTPIVHFSYPEGGPGAYSDAVIAELKRHGVRSGVVVERGVVRPGDDPYRLRRTLVA